MLFANRNGPTVNLGLQGGGAHGAFTWGVLDYLLEDGRLRFDGVSGTSAGAMNAIVLAQGLMEDGRHGARAALRNFWNAVGAILPLGMITQGGNGQAMELTPAMKALLQWTQYFSPEQLNPIDINPLRDILSEQVDFARLRAHSPVKLFVAATHARSGKLRVFRESEVQIDAILASACLPTLHRPVEIDGEPYWDGGYAANPAVFPLVRECSARDVLIVLLAPREYKDMPRTADEIRSRLRELAFNSAFLREMHLLAALRQWVGGGFHCGRLERRLGKTRFHIIEPHEDMASLTPDTKLAASRPLYSMLCDLGRAQARAWMARHYERLGKRSSADLGDLFH